MRQSSTLGQQRPVGGSSTPEIDPTIWSERRRFAGPQLGYYHDIGDIWLEMLPTSVAVRILGVPERSGSWDVSMLWNQFGYLEGTAFPTRLGNTILTGHAHLASGARGPFFRLNQLRWGDEVIIRGFGYRHAYEVRHIGFIRPKDFSLAAYRDRDWVTLLTCKDHDKELDPYQSRMGSKQPSSGSFETDELGTYTTRKLPRVGRHFSRALSANILNRAVPGPNSDRPWRR